VLYGLLFLSLPEWAFQLSQDPGAPKDAGWLRWIIGVALAAWLAATQPDRQRALVVGLALSYLLVALSLLYSTIAGEYQGAQWFVWVPILINLALTAAMIWLITKQARLR
jgi:CHASE2 domain-containing sensor protein